MTLAAPPPVQERLYTAEELLAMPSDARFELIEGRLVPMSPTGGRHSFTTFDLALEIGAFVRDNHLGRCTAAEGGFLLARDPDVVLAPDFAFIENSRLVDPDEDGYLPLIPNLVVETRSPNDRGPQVADKVKRWLSYGVSVIIDADPKRRTMTVYRLLTPAVTLGANDTLTIPEVLPGFSLALSKLF